ncbi:MAG TPA: hypothetical protein VJR89_27275, partial [Polyangiales bacterium]|nr:hypothetical protein [Polyangiales bacterium]
LVYFVGCVALVLVARRGSRAIVLASAALPLALVIGIYAKNAVLFGQFTTSTWLGMNIALRRVEAVPIEERKRLVAEHQLSEVALITPFDPLDHYPAAYADVPARFAAIPALASARKTNGEPNLNHYGYIAIAKQYSADTKQVLRHYPKVLVQSLLRGWFEYFKASSNYWFLEKNVADSWLLRWECRVFDFLLYGILIHNTPGLLLALMIPLLVVYALRVARRPQGRVALDVSEQQRWLLAFLAGTIAWVALVANTLNTLENMRIRFMTDPLLCALLGFWIEGWLLPRLRALRAKRAGAATA